MGRVRLNNSFLIRSGSSFNVDHHVINVFQGIKFCILGAHVGSSGVFLAIWTRFKILSFSWSLCMATTVLDIVGKYHANSFHPD